MKQQTLAVVVGFERFGRQSRRAEFLAQMEIVVPWAELVALIKPHYPDTGKGRPPVGVERMLRTYFLQQWFNLSDPALRLLPVAVAGQTSWQRLHWMQA